MTSSLAKSSNGIAPIASIEWSDEEKKLIKNQIAPGASDNELRLFQAQCRRTGLDPFSRQIYAIMRETWDPATRQKTAKMTIQTSIDGFRVIAQRSGKYAGQDGPFWCGADGVWKDVWLSDELPAAAKVQVFHRDFDRPITGIALFREYAAKKHDGSLLGLWKPNEKPSVMLAKCAEALAFRKAFPNDLSGLYTADEMSQADTTVVDVQVTEAPAKSRRRSIAGSAQTSAPPVAASEPVEVLAETPVDACVIAPVDAPAPAPMVVAAVMPVTDPVESSAALEPSPVAQLTAALGCLSNVGIQALLIAYRSVKGFGDVTDAAEFLQAAKAQATTHLAGLTSQNIDKLNAGLHPSSGVLLVPAGDVQNDPAQPFG